MGDGLSQPLVPRAERSGSVSPPNYGAVTQPEKPSRTGSASSLAADDDAADDTSSSDDE